MPGPASITWWNRLEPRPRAPRLADTLAARVRDPCWMLTRQWMLGEYGGEDAGSQAYARLSVAVSPLVAWRAPDAAVAAALDGRPLEAAVTAEPFSPDLATRVEVGATFLALLAQELAPAATPAALMAALRSRYPIDPAPAARRVTLLFYIPWDAQAPPPVAAGTVNADLAAAFVAHGITLGAGTGAAAAGTSGRWLITDPAADRRYLAVRTGARVDVYGAAVPDRDELRFRQICAGRALDGIALSQVARSNPVPPPFDDPSLTAAQRAAGQRAVSSLQEWIARVLGVVGTGEPPAWSPDRLEYRAEALATTVGGTLASLSARPGRETDFDWHAFDLRESPVTVSGATPGTVSEVTRSVLPAHVRFRGMPNVRWWDFERSTTNFGDIDPDKRDLAKLVVMDFMLIHGNDWFLIPFEQPIGTLGTIRSLVLRDVFDNEYLVERADAGTAPDADSGEWTMFSTATAGPAAAAGKIAPFFLLAPGAGSVQVGPTIEDVRFMRDDMANLVWAHEHVTENALGQPWPAHERETAVRAVRGEAPPPTGVPTGAPPLRYVIQTPVPEDWIPLVPASLDPNRGEFGYERATVLHPSGSLTSPAGKILAPTTPIREEALPHIGLRIERAVSRVRWIDGTTHIWISRRRRVGASDGSSGLRFDQPEAN